MKYLIRVTREPDGETADVEVEADSWEVAKMTALAYARTHPEEFEPMAEHYYVIRAIDNDEEASRCDE